MKTALFLRFAEVASVARAAPLDVAQLKIEDVRKGVAVLGEGPNFLWASRVLMRIPSFAAIQWVPGVQDGGNIYPFRVRKEPKRNIRVWVQDGSEDLEQPSGSWPMQSIQMANSLKMRGYDFHFTFGSGTHNHAQSNSEMPAALAWLWRNYDPRRTDEQFEMDASEKAGPFFA